MNKQEFLNKKYLNLCQQLGDARVKLDQLLEHIDTIKAEIKSLNQSYTIMNELDIANRDLKKESTNE